MQVEAQALADLAEGNRPIVVRNTQPGITIFHDEFLKSTTEWKGAGDPSGGHIRQLSPQVLNNPEFAKNVLTGIFVIESAPEALNAAIAAQRAEWNGRQLAMAESSANLQRAEDKTVSKASTCIHATSNKAELCGVIAADTTDAPPLCVEHKNTAHRYIKFETGRVVKGAAEVAWKRVETTV